MPVIAICPNKHRFVVNLKKHLNRRERFCPVCRAPVNVRPPRWSFTPDETWLKQKQEEEVVRQRKRAQKGTAMPLMQFSLGRRRK